MRQVDVLVGMQWGSEGKGAIASALAQFYNAAVRTGAPNAGHTVRQGEKAWVMRSVPCGWTNPQAQLYVGPGGVLNLEVLEKELEALPEGVRSRLFFDRNAIVVTQEDLDREAAGMNAVNGSTAEGVGEAQARKVMRRNCKTLGQLIAEGDDGGVLPFQLDDHVIDASAQINSLLDDGGSVMLEGTQGFGLSLNHGVYPFVTSRDCIAASLLADAGISPRACRHVFGVMRTYPIRVAGNSGPMGTGQELAWGEITARCGAPEGAIVEKTTVTKRTRRVSEMDWNFMRKSVAVNRPSGLFLTFVDYISWRAHGLRSWDTLPPAVRRFIEQTEKELGTKVFGVKTGPDDADLVFGPAWGDIKMQLERGRLQEAVSER
jgi:adenylosuccinate synthase